MAGLAMKAEQRSLLAQCNGFDKVPAITTAELRAAARQHKREQRKLKREQQLEAAQRSKKRVKRSKHRGKASCNRIIGIEIFAADPCSYCCELGATTHDHLEPVSKGGEHELLNLTRSCYRCNFRKGTQKLIIFLAKRRAAA